MGGWVGGYLDGGEKDFEVLGVGELLGVLDHVAGEGHDVGLGHHAHPALFWVGGWVVEWAAVCTAGWRRTRRFE